jgi:uncharacterized lipoprotein YehR (DUF1307 family)
MNLLNKSLLSALALAFVLGLAACGKKEEGTTGTGTTEAPATGTGTTEQPATGTTGTTTTN